MNRAVALLVVVSLFCLAVAGGAVLSTPGCHDHQTCTTTSTTHSSTTTTHTTTSSSTTTTHSTATTSTTTTVSTTSSTSACPALSSLGVPGSLPSGFPAYVKGENATITLPKAVWPNDTTYQQEHLCNRYYSEFFSYWIQLLFPNSTNIGQWAQIGFIYSPLFHTNWTTANCERVSGQLVCGGSTIIGFYEIWGPFNGGLAIIQQGYALNASNFNNPVDFKVGTTHTVSMNALNSTTWGFFIDHKSIGTYRFGTGQAYAVNRPPFTEYNWITSDPFTPPLQDFVFLTGTPSAPAVAGPSTGGLLAAAVGTIATAGSLLAARKRPSV